MTSSTQRVKYTRITFFEAQMTTDDHMFKAIFASLPCSLLFYIFGEIFWKTYEGLLNHCAGSDVGSVLFMTRRQRRSCDIRSALNLANVAVNGIVDPNNSCDRLIRSVVA